MARRKIEAARYKVAAAAIVLAVIGWFVAGQWIYAWAQKRADAAMAKQAEVAVITHAPDPDIARVISVQGRGFQGDACGWVDLGGGTGIVPFVVRTDPVDVLVPILDQENLEAWVDGLYIKHLVLLRCNGRGLLLPAPADANADPLVDGPISALWSGNGRLWAIIPVPNDTRFIAVARRVGGGMLISPAMDTAALAEAWSLKDGVAYAEAENAKGRARMATYDACLARHPRGDPEREHC
jgi:hypothetical protein